MALITCPECGKEVSEFSENCIGCGYPILKYMNEQKKGEEVISVDITQECNGIRKILSDFKNGYVPLTGMRIDIEKVQRLENVVSEKIGSLSIEAQKEVKGKFAESFCTGLCENNNSDVVNFEDVKKICDIIEISEVSEKSISNMTQIVYAFMETKTGAADILPLSWLIYELLNCGSDSDIKLLEATLKKPDAFDKPRKMAVMEVANKLEAESMYVNTTTTAKVTDEYVPKCPTCGSKDIKKITVASKAGSVALWGLFSQKVKKQWHCNNCSSEW